MVAGAQLGNENPSDMRVSRGYLELLRPANVATALADVLAGYAVAGLPGPRYLAWLLPATACLYAGGVVLNDVFDRDIDRKERPERPIPSGRVTTKAAATLGAALIGAGVILGSMAGPASGAVAAATAGCILLYDAWATVEPDGAERLIEGLRDIHPEVPIVLTASGIEPDWIETVGRHRVTPLVGRPSGDRLAAAIEGALAGNALAG